MWINFTFHHMTDVEKSPSLSKNTVCYLWSFVAKYVFLQFTLFCHEIVLSQFTRYCVEKIWAKNCAHGEKMTNMRYV